MDSASQSGPLVQSEREQLTLEAIERRYVDMKEENKFIKDQLGKLETSTAMSQDNLEKKFDKLQFTLDSILSKMALQAPSDTSSEIAGQSDKKSVGSDQGMVADDMGEKISLKGVKEWKLKKHGLFGDDYDEDDYDSDAARNSKGLHWKTKQKLEEQKLNDLMKDARKALVNYNGERTPHKLHSFVTPLIDYFNIGYFTEKEKIQVTTSRLKGAARRWWDDEKNQARKATTFNEFRAYLESSFSSEATESEIRSDLRNLRQNGRSIEQLEDEFTKLTVLIPLSDAEKCQYWLDALSPELRFNVKTKGSANLSAWTEVKAETYRQEKALKAYQRETRHQQRKSASSNYTNSKSRMSSKERHQRQIDIEEGNCFRCHKPGHQSINCDEPKQKPKPKSSSKTKTNRNAAKTPPKVPKEETESDQSHHESSGNESASSSEV